MVPWPRRWLWPVGDVARRPTARGGRDGAAAAAEFAFSDETAEPALLALLCRLRQGAWLHDRARVIEQRGRSF
jgi:hypothetical protein